MFRGFKTQGWTSADVPLAAGDWLPVGATPASAAPAASLVSAAISRTQPFTILARLRTGPSAQQRLGGLASFGPLVVRWGTTDTRLFVLNGSTTIGLIDQPYAPETLYHIFCRYDGAQATVGVATGPSGAQTDFRTVTATLTFAADAAITMGSTTASAAFQGTLQKAVGWQSFKTMGEMQQFMAGPAY